MRDAAPPVLEVDLGPGIRAALTLARRPAAPRAPVDARRDVRAAGSLDPAGVDGTGGASASDGGFNLSTAVGPTEATAEHRALLRRWIGVPVAYARQVHGADVHLCTAPPSEDVPVAEADALVTAASSLAVAVLVADCVPLLLADPGAGVVAAVHAGRRGLVAGVVPAAVAVMIAQGARPSAIRALVGPSVCGACYEVPADLQAEVADAVPGTASTTSWGTPALDLAAGVRQQLEAVDVVRVEQMDACTLTDTRWYSHRGAFVDPSRTEGRFAALARALPGARVSPPSRASTGLA